MQQLTGPELLELHATEGPGFAPVLLDVREPWEFALAPVHVGGLRTVHIPMGELTGRLAELDPSQPVVCICHHGMRSAQVVAFLAHHGFGSAYNLAGGTEAWSQQVDANVVRY
ncbi:MAG: sulfurtransferase [Bacteriovorax sp.]|nr:sulfurtransferase [Rhizobacter sp.]